MLLGLENVGLVYLDHAGATMYSELQMEAIFKDFTSNAYGNPRIRLRVKWMISVLEIVM